MKSDTPGEFRGLLEDDDFVRSLVNSLFAFVAVLDPDGTVLDVNQPALRVADLSASDVRGKLFWDCSWWSFSDAIANEVKNDCLEAARGQSIRRDAVVRIAGDARMMVDFQITPARDAQGDIAHLIASGVDITTARHAEEALRRSDEKEAILLRLMRVQKEATDPDAIMAEAVRAIGQKLQVNRVGFWEMRDEDTLAFGECWADGSLGPLTGTFPAEGIGLRYLAQIRSGHTIAIEDVDESSLTEGSMFREIGARSVIGAPIFRGGEWVAGLYVNHGQPRSWEGEELALVREVAEQTWESVGRARASRAQQENEERLGIAAEAAGLGIFDLDLATGSYRWDERVRSFWGVSADEVIGHETFREGLHPDDRRSTEEALARAYDPSGDGRYRAEYRIIPRDGGNLRWISALGDVFFENGRPVRLVGTVQDITRSKQIEETLRVYERAMASTVNAVLIADATDPEHPLLYVNDAFERITGYTKEEVIGTNCRFLNREDRGQPELSTIREALRDGRPVEALIRNRRKDGLPFWNQLSIAPVHDDKGLITHFVGIAHDVTSEIDAASERERLLQEAQSARREAERANQAKNDFLSVVSHDLRSPLNTMSLWAGLIRDEATTPELLKASDAIENAIKVQNRLIEDLIDVSQMISGALELERTVVDLNQRLSGLTEELQLVADTQGVALRSHLLDVPAPVFADELRLEQVFRNIVGNALKFTPRGGSVEVRLEPSDDGFEVAVSDTGCGIDSDVLPKIFDRFWHTGRHERGGLGLGLAIADHLVRAHGGALSAESVGQGEGSTFRIRLPRSGREVVAQSTLSPSFDHQSLDDLEILVVDDDPGTIEVLSSSLENRGATVLTASTAEEAIECCRDAIPDVLVSDIGLPGRDGFSLVRAVRELGFEGRRLPAIAVTGWINPAARRRAFRAGFDLYLAKPVEAAALVREIERVRRVIAEPAAVSSSRRILVVDADSQSSLALANHLVSRGHAVEVASDTAGALALVERVDPEISIIDLDVKTVDGLDLIRRLQAVPLGAIYLGVASQLPAESDQDPFHLILPRPLAFETLDRFIALTASV